MRAVVLKAAGGTDNFIILQRPIPEPLFDQVLIKVKAFGLNRSELMTRKGYSPNVQFPRVLGIECVGEIEKDPSGQFLPGQKVAAFMGGMGRDFDGSYAEFVLVPKGIVMPFESTLEWHVLGSLPEMFQTAYGSLFHSLALKATDNLLIRGGTSSVGILASQLASNFGTNVCSTSRNPNAEGFMLQNGATHFYLDDGNLVDKVKSSGVKINKVLELVGAPTLKDSLACLQPGGIVCMTGMLSEQWSISDFAPMDFISSGTYLTVYDSGQSRVGSKEFQDFILQIENRKIAPVISKFFHLENIREAHDFMESNHGSGKIVVITE